MIGRRGGASVAVLKVGPCGDAETGTATGQADAFVLTNGVLDQLLGDTPAAHHRDLR